MSLDIEVGIKNAPFRAGLQQMRTQASKFNGDLKGMFMGSIGGIAAAFSAGGIASAFGKIISQAGEIKKLSSQFGVDAQALQKVGNGLAKGNLEAVAPLLNKLIINQQKAREGNKSLSASFDTLGISAGELNSLSPDELLFRIADGAKNATDRNAAYLAVVSVLGKSAGEFFDKLAKGSAELKANGSAMGIYSDKAITSFAGLGKQADRLKSNVLPVLADISAWVLRIGIEGAKTAKALVWDLPKDLVGHGEGRKGAISRFYGKVDDIGAKVADEVGLGWINGKKPASDKGTQIKRPAGTSATGYSGDGDTPSAGGGENPQTRINALEAQHSKLLDEQFDKSLSSAALVNTLTERKVRLESQAAEASKNGHKEESLKLQNSALEIGVKLSEEKHRIAQEIAASAERLASIERETQLAGMTAETRIKAMTEERTRILREANLAQIMGEPEKAGALRVKAAEVERNINHETKNVDAERARISDALFANEQEARMKTMSAEEKILELTAQRKQLLKEASDAVAPGKAPDYDTYGKKQLAASDKQKEISEAVEQRNEQAKRDEEQIADKEKQRREKQISKMPAKEQRAIRVEEKETIDKELADTKTQMADETDPDKKRALRGRMADLGLRSDDKADQISEIDKQTASAEKQKKRQGFTVTTDSFQRVGGGGRAYGPAADPTLRAQEKSGRTLEEIRDLLKKDRSEKSYGATSRPEPY